MSDFDLIIISHNNKDLTEQAINSALNSSILPKMIILVDNHSSDGTVEYISQIFPGIRLIKNLENRGYAYAVNLGFNQSISPIVIISNNDVIIKNNVFEEIINTLDSNPKIGVLGVLQRYPNGKKQHSYGVIPGILSALRELLLIEPLKYRFIRNFLPIFGKKIIKVGYVDGAFMAIRKEAFNDVSGFDQRFFFYFEESDFCKRVRDKDWNVCVDLQAEIVHYRGQYSSNKTGLEHSRVGLYIDSLHKYATKHFKSFERKLFLFIKLLEFLLASGLKMFQYFLTRDDGSKIVSEIKIHLAKEVFYLLKSKDNSNFKD